MNQVPAWIQVLQALLTPTIAVGVGVVAFLQWRTAHHKVVLELFDRRMKVYEQVEEAINYVLSHDGNLVGSNTRRKLSTAWMNSRFIFGNDVQDHIFDIQRKAAALAYYKNRTNRPGLSEVNRSAAENKVTIWEEALMASHASFSNICRAYMAMDQKKVQTLSDWISDRNRVRLSYADEKQK